MGDETPFEGAEMLIMLGKISIGFSLGAVGSIFVVIVLDGLLAPHPPDVPYGSMMGMPIFYLGILGAVLGTMADLVSRSRIAQAAATGIVGGGVVGTIMLIYWLDSNFPLLHYSYVVMLLPVVIVSGLIILLGILLNLRLAISRKRRAQ